jgi:hypothetical protein
MDEHIGGSIGISWHQISGVGIKRHEAPISAYTWVSALIIALPSPRGHTDPCGGSRLAIVDKDVSGTIGIAQDQIGSPRLKCYEAAVCTYTRVFTTHHIGLPPSRGDADPGGDAGLLVMYKDILNAIGIA